MANLYAVLLLKRKRGDIVRVSWWKRGRVGSHVSCCLVPLNLHERPDTPIAKSAIRIKPASPPSFERSSPNPIRNHNAQRLRDFEY
jgi:hypothetical protein